MRNASQAVIDIASCFRFSSRHSSLFTRHFFWAVAILLALVARPLVADDLTLKDGKKITGTIVGFENGMFRLATEYGFILVQRDKVASIKVTDSGVKNGLQKSELHSGANEVSGNASGAESIPASSAATNSPTVAPPSPPPKPVPVSRVLDVPLPAHIDEHEEGSNYVNDTFHFSMFKPPGWKIYREDLPQGKISAIVALASDDEQTLLFVDRQVWSGAPDLKNDGVESNIRNAYQDYKKLSESNTEISGLPAIRHDFTGVMDGAEWHGVAIRVAQGSTVYGILGMTSAESFEFQEAVLNKIVKSFRFLAQTGAADAPRGTSAH
ncbi:MAG TPA: hypothetical protein VKV95_04965 [Terriglobia bacterium]|nr:hypothetical protein [Terriglobia bacterium]